MIGTLEIGGAEKHLVDLAARLDRRRFLPHVCVLAAGGPLQPRLERAGVPVHVVDSRGLRGRRDPASLFRLGSRLRRLYRLMRAEKFDVVQAYLFWAYIPAAFIGRAARVPLIIAARRSLGNFKAGRPGYRFLEGLANRMTDLLIANSDAVKDDVVRREKVSPEKILVIRGGLDPAPFLKAAGSGAAKRRELGIDPSAPLLGVVANYIHYKGHRDLIAAFPAVLTEFPEARCLLIGEGPMRPALEAQILDSGLTGRVLLTGTRTDVPEILAALDVSVLPSHEEGFSNTILESMAAGKPVVATAVGGNPEAVVDGVTGRLVPPGDPGALAAAVTAILGDPAGAARMGEAGRRRVLEEFSIGTMLRRLESVYGGWPGR